MSQQKYKKYKYLPTVYPVLLVPRLVRLQVFFMKLESFHQSEDSSSACHIYIYIYILSVVIVLELIDLDQTVITHLVSRLAPTTTTTYPYRMGGLQGGARETDRQTDKQKRREVQTNRRDLKECVTRFSTSIFA